MRWNSEPVAAAAAAVDMILDLRVSVSIWGVHTFFSCMVVITGVDMRLTKTAGTTTNRLHHLLHPPPPAAVNVEQRLALLNSKEVLTVGGS